MSGASTHPSVEDEMRERFQRDTADHELTVLHDDGLYRHLRVKAPGDFAYWFDVVTWPGNLCVTGDCGTYVFARIQDMFEFFRRPSRHGEASINAWYWGEKLKAPQGRDRVRVFSEEAYHRRVGEWIAYQVEQLEAEDVADFTGAVSEQLLDPVDNEHDAQRRLAEFTWKHVTLQDAWEWDLRDWDWAYIWSCWAIVDAIARYDEHAEAPA